MRVKRKAKAKEPPQVTRSSKGQPLTLDPLLKPTKKSIRGIMKEVVGQHSTEVGLRIREGLLSENLRLQLKYLTLVAAYDSGKPVETHRMVNLDEGPSGSYDLSRLPPEDQKKLLTLLRKSKDDTKPKGKA